MEAEGLSPFSQERAIPESKSDAACNIS